MLSSNCPPPLSFASPCLSPMPVCVWLSIVRRKINQAGAAQFPRGDQRQQTLGQHGGPEKPSSGVPDGETKETPHHLPRRYCKPRMSLCIYASSCVGVFDYGIRHAVGLPLLFQIFLYTIEESARIPRIRLTNGCKAVLTRARLRTRSGTLRNIFTVRSTNALLSLSSPCRSVSCVALP